MTGRPEPRAVWTRILRWLVPREDCDHVLQELAALYSARVEQRGRRAADRWYRGEVLAYITALRIRRRRTGVSRSERFALEGAIGNLWRDVKRSGRSLLCSPGFSIVAVVTLTLGIGANAVIFTVVDHIAFRSLPYHQPHELVWVWPNSWMVQGELDIIEREATSFSSVGGFLRTDGLNLHTDAGSRRVQGHHVSPAIFRTLGVQPMLGRVFQSEESDPGSDGVALLSYGLWRDEYGADPEVVGRTVVLDGRAREVVGVLPAGFGFPDAAQDILVPMIRNPADAGAFWGYGGISAVARLTAAATSDAATAEVRALAEEMRVANPLWTPLEGYRDEANVTSMRDALVGDVEPTLLILLGAVGIVFVVASANVSNLLLARGLGRERDVALRAALGASRGRLLRERLCQLSESQVKLKQKSVGIAQAAVAALHSLKERSRSSR